ncbi:MAG: PaaI family thioesterase [Pseudomonadota bacterium]|nr:PaaI family thioesterase [Pseudomonadota bacterium]
MTALPPYARLLDLRIVTHDDGDLVVMPFGDDVLGRPGFLHGGAIAGLLEFAAFNALASALGEERATMKPVTITVDYMRGGAERLGDTYATALIERLGKRIANVEAFAWQQDRAKPIAAARINFLIDREAQ